MPTKRKGGEKKVVFQYDHKTRMCEYPECKRRSTSRGKAHSDGSLYRCAWCKFHLKGKGKEERQKYAGNIKKYIPKDKKPTESVLPTSPKAGAKKKKK